LPIALPARSTRLTDSQSGERYAVPAMVTARVLLDGEQFSRDTFEQ